MVDKYLTTLIVELKILFNISLNTLLKLISYTVVSCILLLGIINYIKVDNIDGLTDDITDDHFPSVIALSNMANILSEIKYVQDDKIVQELTTKIIYFKDQYDLLIRTKNEQDLWDNFLYSFNSFISYDEVVSDN